MSDDKKLPVKSTESLPPVSETPGYLTTPGARGGWLSRTVGRLVHTHRARTIRAATDETEALRDNLKAHEDVYNQAGRTAAAADAFFYDTPRIIDNNRANTDHFMTEEATRRAIEAEESTQRLNEIKARGRRGGMQGNYDDRVARFENEAALADAEMRAERARWGLEAFRQSMPFRRDRIEQLYKKGALDAELDRIILEGERDSQLGRSTTRGSDGIPDAERTVLEQTLAEVDLEIENAYANHASKEVLEALANFRAKVSARLRR